MGRAEPQTPAAPGPLRVHPDNPRYFADPAGRAVYLAGSHTWANWIEHKLSPDDADFDYPAYLDFMAAHNHNFMRFWGWEHARWANWDATGKFFAYPLAYARTGGGAALDGLAKFDLTKFDPAFFDRLRQRVMAAGRRGIYAAVKLFDGFSVGFKGSSDDRPQTDDRNPYRGHPFHAANNVNGIDADPGRTGQGKSIHTLAIPAVTRCQEAYVRKVIDTVNDLPNVLYEICNEPDAVPEAIQWQYHMIRFIKQYQAAKPAQHPVGMTAAWFDPANQALFDGPADWISPNHTAAEPYRDDPPPADGAKVIVADTDHLWGHGGNSAWVWKSFTRGLHTLLMDPWEPVKGSNRHDNNCRDHPTWEPIRRSMGHTRTYAEKMDLASMAPAGDLASTGYCLANPAREYLVYQSQAGTFQVDLSAGPGPFTVEWFNPNTGAAASGGAVPGGARQDFTPPFDGDAVLYLKTASH